MSRYFAAVSSLVLGAGLLFAGPTSNPATAAPLGINSINLFGDSLSDIGNDYFMTNRAVPPDSRYYQGRFSNGPVWIEYLAGSLGLRLRPSRAAADIAAGNINFAYGGTTTGAGNLTPGGFFTPGVLAQVDSYRTALAGSGRTVDPGTLNVVWGGANDYLLGVTGDPTVPPDNLTTAIEELYASGARLFLVPNLPDLAVAPAAAGNPEISALSTQHNRNLEQALAELDRTLTGATLIRFDVEGLFDTWLADPAAYSFTSGSVAGPAAGCLLPPFNCSPVQAVGSPFFWDEQHPSTLVHLLLAQAAYEVLSEAGPVHVPEPGPFVLILGGLIGLGLLARSPIRRPHSR
jgi:thermolabile hemolysin